VPGDFENLFKDYSPLPIKSGVLEILPGGWGLLQQNVFPISREIYVSQIQINESDLKSGDTVTGQVRPPKETEKYPVLLRVDAVNGCRKG